MTMLDTPSVVTEGDTSLFERCVCISLEIGVFGNVKNVHKGLVEVDADKESIDVSKKLLDSPELKAIQKLDGKTRTFLYSKSLPSPFRAGTYALPILLFDDVETSLGLFKTERSKLVDTFVREYPRLVKEAALRLRAVYNPLDYLSPEEVFKTFRMDWKYFSYGVPEALKSLDASVYQREGQKLKESVRQVEAEIATMLKASLVEMIDTLKESVTPKSDGSFKRFYETSVTNVTEFLATLDARNITNDAELRELGDKVRGVLRGITPKDVRENSDVKKYVQDSLASVSGTVASMTEVAPSRRIVLKD